MFDNSRSAFMIFAFLVGGCGGPVSTVDRFKSDQVATVTPYGRINMDSVSESQEGRINYQTQDGSSWQVQIETAADGSARYNQPVRQIKQD